MIQAYRIGEAVGARSKMPRMSSWLKRWDPGGRKPKMSTAQIEDVMDAWVRHTARISRRLERQNVQRSRAAHAVRLPKKQT